MSRLRVSLTVLAALLAGCGSERGGAPEIVSVAPDEGVSALETMITIRGTFSVDVTVSFSDATQVVGTDFRARLSETPLEQVSYVDRQTLTARIPAGLAPGRYDLVVTDPSGRSGELQGAVQIISWWHPDWTKRREITFDQPAGVGSLTDFPVLVALDPSRIDYSATQPGGEDLRFVSAVDNVVLPHEIELWSAGGDSLVWVRAPRISPGSGGDSIHLYYGNPAAVDGEAGSSVWDPAFRGVWHLDRQLFDSTANANNGIDRGTSSTPGIAADGRLLNSGQFVELGNDPSLQITTSVTLEAWARVDLLGTAHHPILNKGDLAYALKVYQDDHFEFHVNDGTWRAAFSDAVARAGVWTYIVGTFDGDNVHLYVDGTLQAQTNNATGINSTNAALAIGHNDDQLDRTFVGAIDETRISDIARSADWISTQYRSMTDVLLQYGVEEIWL